MRFTPLRIALIYLGFALLWITTTDQILEWLVDDLILLSRLQTAKGYFYVIITAIVLYWMMKSYEKYISVNSILLKRIPIKVVFVVHVCQFLYVILV